jgi:hypothetical protein
MLADSFKMTLPYPRKLLRFTIIQCDNNLFSFVLFIIHISV